MDTLLISTSGFKSYVLDILSFFKNTLILSPTKSSPTYQNHNFLMAHLKVLYLTQSLNLRVKGVNTKCEAVLQYYYFDVILQ